MPKRILLVEDDPGVRLTLRDRLAGEGYVVESAVDGEEGLARVAAEPFDLVVLDVMLPGRSGFDVCRDLRQKGLDLPVLMLTARRQVADRVVGLKLGADDYLVKPFDVAELLARVEARLRRAPEPTAGASVERYRFGEVEADFRRAEVRHAGRLLDLSAKEYQLLRYFIQHRGSALSRDELLDGVWGYDAMPSTRTVDTHVAWLRAKVEPNRRHPQFILTIHGVGYKFAG
jgi:two-component system alkaline phosphatase synthesis response regulator PhoP